MPASTPVKDSPFDSPAARDKTPEFQKQFDALVAREINPAAKRYADFLEKEYLPAAREAIPVTANPNGGACYNASVLYHSSSPKTANEVHDLGVKQNERLIAEMKAIGERSFATTDIPALLARLRTDPKYRFKSRVEKIAYSQAALARAKAAVPSVFGLLPKADVVIKPYPAFREKNAPNEYNPPAEDGSRPAVFFISAYQAERQNRVEDESTAFHETIPGHHLQGAIAQERKEIHPLGRYIANSGYSSQESSAAADDAEPAWDPGFTSTHDFIAGYNSAANWVLFEFGSLESGYWSRANEYYVAYTGANFPLPQVYYSSMAASWEELELWAVANRGGSMLMLGVTSEWPAPETLTPHQGYDAMLTRLQTHTSTYQSSLDYLTDI